MIWFRRTAVCLLTIISCLNGLVVSQQPTVNAVETSSDPTSTLPKSIKKLNISSNENMNATALDGAGELTANITTPPTRISKDSIDNNNVTAYAPIWLLNIKSGALERTGFVALGIMSILLLFFVIRAIRVRHKSKSRKYGIITSTASEMEMEPLEGRHDDDEEETLFDVQEKYLIK